MTDTDFPAFPKGDGNGVPGWVEPRPIWISMTSLVMGAVALLCFIVVFAATFMAVMSDPAYPGQPIPGWAVSLDAFLLRFGGFWVLASLVLMAGGGIGLLRRRSR